VLTGPIETGVRQQNLSRWLVQARVNKSGEISEHFGESCVKSEEYGYPVNWISGKRALMLPCTLLAAFLHVNPPMVYTKRVLRTV
jgi:hypothetical protein